MDQRYTVFVVKAREKGMEIVLEKMKELKYLYKFALDMEHTVFISVFSSVISGDGSQAGLRRRRIIRSDSAGRWRMVIM